jgi:hypothetical protein
VVSSGGRVGGEGRPHSGFESPTSAQIAAAGGAGGAATGILNGSQPVSNGESFITPHKSLGDTSYSNAEGAHAPRADPSAYNSTNNNRITGSNSSKHDGNANNALVISMEEGSLSRKQHQDGSLPHTPQQSGKRSNSSNRSGDLSPGVGISYRDYNAHEVPPSCVRTTADMRQLCGLGGDDGNDDEEFLHLTDETQRQSVQVRI